MIEVVKPGFYSLVQDAGRYGYQAYGMPVSGALDIDSFRLSNWLVGNSMDEAVLEITLTGPVLRFEKDVCIGITGANMQPQIDGVSVKMYATIFIKKGSLLSFGKLETGCRTYVSVSGGFQIKKYLGSSSTYTYAKLGGVKGRQLRIADVLKVKSCIKPLMKNVPKEFEVKSFQILAVNVIEGPEAKLFEKEELDKFYNHEYTIASDSNRMGYRLLGEKINTTSSFEMLSSGIVKGTIQLPSNGQPIVLLADAQTTGGYPRIANIIQADLSMIAQQKPGDKIRFRKVSLEEAHAIGYHKEKSYRYLLESRFLKKRDCR